MSKVRLKSSLCHLNISHPWWSSTHSFIINQPAKFLFPLVCLTCCLYLGFRLCICMFSLPTPFPFIFYLSPFLWIFLPVYPLDISCLVNHHHLISQMFFSLSFLSFLTLDTSIYLFVHIPLILLEFTNAQLNSINGITPAAHSLIRLPDTEAKSPFCLKQISAVSRSLSF